MNKTKMVGAWTKIESERRSKGHCERYINWLVRREWGDGLWPHFLPLCPSLTHSEGTLASLEQSHVLLPQENLLFPLSGMLVFHISAWLSLPPFKVVQMSPCPKDLYCPPYRLPFMASTRLLLSNLLYCFAIVHVTQHALIYLFVCLHPLRYKLQNCFATTQKNAWYMSGTQMVISWLNKVLKRQQGQVKEFSK